ncbi:hypothetical protein [Nocardia salmonicida]|uniref:hypothetical protein n=1 Tax=Nocardia salmonicida TaxID=53431 RepID=UPI0007A3A337|nr:hypothetical protein [Nocardia salmonicida]
MSQPDLPEIVELDAVLIPEKSNFHISESRHIVVALALFAETATLHTVTVMADSLTDPLTDHVIFGLRDERDTEYRLLGGGHSGVGISVDAHTRFRRPDRQRPLALTVSWKRSKANLGGDLFTVDVPSRT